MCLFDFKSDNVFCCTVHALNEEQSNIVWLKIKSNWGLVNKQNIYMDVSNYDA